MVRRPPSRFSILLVLALAAAFGVLTLGMLLWPPLQAFDERTTATRLDPNSATAQIAAAFALLTWPGLQYAAILAVAFWAYRNRFRQLAIALCLLVGFGWGGGLGLKFLIHRERPDQALDLLTALGYSYPSNHVVAVVACSIGVGAALAVTRQSAKVKLGWQAGAAVLTVAVAFDRWVLGGHFLSDIVGGALFGALAGTAALVAAGVSVPVPHEVVQELVRGPGPALVEGAPAKRCAVIYNPAKVTDWVTFRRHVEYELASRGWERAIWLETTESDPGRAMTAAAVAERVDLVLGAGGDGTIRAICAGLAHSGTPFGLIPAGTGNLLARNLGIPRDEAAALSVAFDGVDTPIDLVRLSVDGAPPAEADYFTVMAGIGLDAVIMQGTNPDLKKAVGSAAYFVSAAQNANHPALHATIQVDDLPPLKRRAHVIVIGNVGYLQANIPLIPDARPDDGLLDVLVASPRSVRDWVKLTARVLTRQRRTDDQLDRLTGRRVTIAVEQRDHYQMDGDTVGECNTMVAEVQPGALLLRLPRTRRDLTAERTVSGIDLEAETLPEATQPTPQGLRSWRNQAAASA